MTYMRCDMHQWDCISHYPQLVCTYHDIMRQTLTKVISPTVSPESDSAKQHLCPSQDRIGLAHHSVSTYSPWADGLLVYVELQVYAEEELQSNGSEENVRHLSVCAG